MPKAAVDTLRLDAQGIGALFVFVFGDEAESYGADAILLAGDDDYATDDFDDGTATVVFVCPALTAHDRAGTLSDRLKVPVIIVSGDDLLARWKGSDDAAR